MDGQAVSPANKPSNPSQELASRNSWTGPTLANGVLTAELAEFCQSGVSVVLASCDRVGRPIVGRGLACLIDGVGHVRIFVRQSPNAAVLRALAAGAGLAATFTRPTTHRSIQLKAAKASLGTPVASDHPAVIAQTTAFQADLIESGYTEFFASGYCAFDPHELAAVGFLPDRAFAQTPGPLAGSELQP